MAEQDYAKLYRLVQKHVLRLLGKDCTAALLYHVFLAGVYHHNGGKPRRVPGEHTLRPLKANEYVVSCDYVASILSIDPRTVAAGIRRLGRALRVPDNLRGKVQGGWFKFRIVPPGLGKELRSPGVYVWLDNNHAAKWAEQMEQLTYHNECTTTVVVQQDNCTALNAPQPMHHNQCTTSDVPYIPQPMHHDSPKHYNGCTEYKNNKEEKNKKIKNNNDNGIIVSEETTFQNRVREVPTSGYKPRSDFVSSEEQQDLTMIISWWDSIAESYGMPLQKEITPPLLQKYRALKKTKLWQQGIKLHTLKTEITLSPYLQGKAGPETPVRDLPWLLQTHILTKTLAGGYRPTTKQAQYHQQPQASTAGSNRGKTPEQMQEIVMQNYRYLEQQAKKFRAVMQQAKDTAPMAPMVPNATEVPLKPPPLTQEQMNETWKQFR